MIDRKQRLTFFSHESQLFGAPRSLLALLEAEVLRRDVRLVVAEEGPLVERAVALGISVDRMPRAFREGPSYGARFFYGSRLVRYLRVDAPDLVYVNTVAHASPVLAAAVVGLPSVLHVRESAAYFRPRTAAGRWRLRRLLRHPAAIVCVSEATRRLVLDQGVRPDRTHLIYNGVDVDRFSPDEDARNVQRKRWGIAKDEVVFAFVGQWSHRKGVDLIVEAAATVQASCPDARFVFVGGGNDQRSDQEFRDRAAARIPFAPRFVSFTEDVRPALRAADVFLCPSRAEPFARVNLEAMAMGVPVVASAVGGNPEAVEDGKTGILFPNEDLPRLIQAMQSMAADPARRRALGEQGRIRAIAEFSMQRYTDRVGRLLDTLLAKVGTR